MLTSSELYNIKNRDKSIWLVCHFYIHLPLIQHNTSADFFISTEIENEVLWTSKLLVHKTAESLSL